MLKSFDYVDPLLAQKIRNLELELKKVEQSKQQIINNKKINTITRDRLLKYQNECSVNIESMLSKQRDKLAEYLDEQTIVISKTNRSSSIAKITKSQNMTLNQSTRIDLSIDQSKSLDATMKTEVNRKISTFYLPATPNSNVKYGNKTLLKIRRLKKQVRDKDKIIKLLVSWIKIYYEREQAYSSQIGQDFTAQSTALIKQNSDLRVKCQQLEEDIMQIRSNFKDKTLSILKNHQKYEQIKGQNAKLQLQRKELLNNARSLKKQHS